LGPALAALILMNIDNIKYLLIKVVHEGLGLGRQATAFTMMFMIDITLVTSIEYK
jgi:hypothetical protein